MKEREIIGLSYTQSERLRYAISQGLLDDFERDPRGWKHSFKGTYLWRYPSRVKHVQHIIEIVGHEPAWEEITDDVVKDFVDETCEMMSASSARTICAELKAVLNANKRKIAAQDFNATLTLRNEKSQHVYLNADEMERFLAYKPQTPIERFVYRNFAVEMLTGARLSDAQRITIHNCDCVTGMLSYIPKKTPGVVVSVPVDERRNLRRILTMDRLRECCLDVFNQTVRDICKTVGLYEECTLTRAGRNVTASKWQLVSSHTARRSFATNLYLAGISLEDVAVMMGHGKNIETTRRYICADREIRPSVMSYFQPTGS